MATIARSPVGLSWQNTTCSCPAGSSRPVNTPMAAPDTKVRPGLVGPAVLSGGVLPAVPSLTPPLLPHRDASARPGTGRVRDAQGRLEVARSRRAVAVRLIPAGVRAAGRFRAGTPGFLAPVRQGGSGRRPAGGPRPAAHGRAGGARRELEPAARTTRRGVRHGDRRDAAGVPVEPAQPGRRGGADRPRRGTERARGRVRAADLRGARQDRRGGLAQRVARTGARPAPAARAGGDLGGTAAL